MRILIASIFLLSLGAAAAELSSGNPSRPTPSPAPATGVRVQMISATLADQCGGTGAPWSAPVPHPAPLASEAAGRASMKMGARACQQTAMQLSVMAGPLAGSAEIHIKKVEIFDSTGKSIGELTPRSPMVWSAKDSAYQPWKETVASGETLSVSYALSSPNWSAVPDRSGKTFTLRATVTVGGADQTVQRDVRTETMTHLPPGVVT